MTTPVIPLVCYPWPLSSGRLELLKLAKASLTDIDVKVIPVEAVPGTQARVLSFGGRPPFYCKYAPILPENVDKIESIAAALRFVLTVDGKDTRFDETAWLSDVFGAPVVFSHAEDEFGPVFA